MVWKIAFTDPHGRPAESIELETLEAALRYARALESKQGCKVNSLKNIDGSGLEGPALRSELDQRREDEAQGT
jgi:hypothetical protein